MASADPAKCDHPEWSPIEGYMVCRTCDAIATFNPVTREWKISRLEDPRG